MFRLSTLLALVSLLCGSLAAQSWKRQPSPSPGDVQSIVQDLAYIADDDIWAAGRTINTTGLFFRDLLLHYDGNLWSTVTAPEAKPLVAVDGTGPADVWLASDNKLWHHDGSGWTDETSAIPYPVYSPPSFTPFFITDIVALAPDDVYVCGYKSTTFPVLYVLGNWMIHWDGTSWSEISLPDPYTDRNTLLSMDVWDPDNILAVGDGKDNALPFGGQLIQKVGGSWTIPALPAPVPPAGETLGSTSALRDVSYLGDGTAYAVGDYETRDAAGVPTTHTMTYYWDGSAWTFEEAPASTDSAGNYTYVQGIDGATRADAWTGSRPSLLQRASGTWTETPTVFDTVGGIIQAMTRTPTGLLAGGVDPAGNSLILVRTSPTAACNSAMAPGGLTVNITPTRAELQWTPMVGTVACQVKADRTTPAPLSGTANVVAFEPERLDVPLTALGAGSAWTWRVRCACSISPLDASAFSAPDTFSVPALKQAVPGAPMAPNPAADRTVFRAPFPGTLRIADPGGRPVLERRVTTGEHVELDLSGWSAGAYGWHLAGANGRSHGTLVVQRP